MIKKLFLIVSLFIACNAMAQVANGSWKMHPFFVSTKVQNNIDTGNDVYFLASNTLYRYNKESATVTPLNTSNVLHDVSPTAIFYNESKNYILVAYNNSNIDIIKSDGRVINIPELKDAVITQSKAINNATFDNKHAYIATDFGFVVLDDENFVIKESHIYETKITSVAHVGDLLIASIETGVKYCDFDSKREKAAAFRSSGLYLIDMEFFPIDDTHFFINSKTSLDLCTINGTTFSTTNIAPARAASIQRIPNGFVANFPALNYYITTNAAGGAVVKKNCNGEMISCNPNGDGTMWTLGPNGLSKLGESAITKPNGIGISTIAFWAQYNPGDQNFYLASTTDNSLLSSANIGAKTEIWNYDGNQWQNVTPPNVPLYYKGDTYQGNYWMNFIPGTTNSYVMALRAQGVIQVVDGQIKANYVAGSNMPLLDKYKPATAIDNEGNLWCAQSYNTKDNKTAAVLPKEKLANPAAVKLSDWTLVYVPNMEVGFFKGSSFAITKGSDIKVYNSGSYQKQVVMWNSKGNPLNSNPDSRSFTQFKCTDGKAFMWDYVYCLYPAHDGTIWMGTNSGLVAFDPAQAFTGEMQANHMKVLSDDGVSEEYLLDGLQVNYITEDSLHRKLIGTRTNGFYIVNSTGTEILAHFNTDNSVLPDNCVYTIAYNPTTNSALVVTMNGVIEYFLDKAPSAQDYSAVSVFPNPVRPDFTGLVTVSNLMDNSTVQFVAPDQRVVKQLTSNGGTCTWDCNDDNGDRVPSGLYTIKAATGTNTPQPVATVLILK